MDLIAVQNQFLMFYPISNLRPLLAYFNFIKVSKILDQKI